MSKRLYDSFLKKVRLLLRALNVTAKSLPVLFFVAGDSAKNDADYSVTLSSICLALCCLFISELLFTLPGESLIDVSKVPKYISFRANPSLDTVFKGKENLGLSFIKQCIDVVTYVIYSCVCFVSKTIPTSVLVFLLLFKITG